MYLGICKDSGRIFMGRMENGYIVSPLPVVSPCKITSDKSDCQSGPDTSNVCNGFAFLEDYFDSKSRLRRGRIYRAMENQPKIWSSNGKEVGELYTFSRCSILAQHRVGTPIPTYLLLGDKRRFTVWKLIDVEVTSLGEELLTIKSISSFGVLPYLMEEVIPKEHFPLIQEQLTLVLDEMHFASPVSVVDCCREAAVTVLGAFVNSPEKDLGSLVSLMARDGNNEWRLVRQSAGIIKDLHPRRKSSEIRSKGLRRISVEDAQLAVQCLGAILIEIEWGRW